jgi:hypothetical protein
VAFQALLHERGAHVRFEQIESASHFFGVIFVERRRFLLGAQVASKANDDREHREGED